MAPKSQTNAATYPVLAAIVIILLLDLVLVPVVMMVMMMGMGGLMGGIGNVMGQWGMPIMCGLGGLIVIFILLLLVGIVLLLARGTHAGDEQRTDAGPETPLAILQQRFARGEIGGEEYERIRSDLIRDGGDR